MEYRTLREQVNAIEPCINIGDLKKKMKPISIYFVFVIVCDLIFTNLCYAVFGLPDVILQWGLSISGAMMFGVLYIIFIEKRIKKNLSDQG